MELADQSKVLSKRLENMINSITTLIYTNVCRGLFEAHKLIFSFLIATSINKKQKLLSEALWSVFLRGAGVIEKNK